MIRDRTRADGLRTLCYTFVQSLARTGTTQSVWLAAWNTDHKVFRSRFRDTVVRRAEEYRATWGQDEDVFDALRHLV